jgi:hypothetical protein
VPTIHPSAPTSSIPLRYIILQYGYFTLSVKISYCLHYVVLQAIDRSGSVVKWCLLLYIYAVYRCDDPYKSSDHERMLHVHTWAQPCCLPAPFAQICVITRLFGSASPLRFVPNWDHERREEQVVPRFWLHTHGRVWSCPVGRAVTFRV